MKHATANAMSLRARINNYAKEHGILAQVVLQNYMFECLLDRNSQPTFCNRGKWRIAKTVGKVSEKVSLRKVGSIRTDHRSHKRGYR